MQLIREGKVDIIPGIGISEARKNEFAFSKEIESIPVSCFVRTQNTAIRTINDLVKHKTAVIEQSAAYTYLKKKGYNSLIQFKTIEPALFALLAGEVDAFIFPEPVLKRKARLIGVDKKIKTIGKPLIDLKRGFMVSKTNTHLISFFNPFIENLVKSPEYKKMYLKWYGENNPPVHTKTIFLIMLALLIISSAALMIWRNISIAAINRKLTEQKNYLNILKTNTPDAMYLSNMNGKIVDVNNESCRALGYSYQELLTKNVTDIDADISDISEVQHFWKNMEIGRTQKVEGLHKRKDGTDFPVEVNISSLMINNEKHLLGFARDLTERQQIEEQLRQSHKMQAVGQLAGGIAHDFNNLLSGIIGYADMSLTKIKAGSDIHKYINNILTAGEHARRLVEQILTFSRSNKETMKVLNLSSVISESIELLSSTMPSSVKIITEFEHNTPAVMADRTRINEALMNLVTNSVHAINESGKVKISLITEKVDAPRDLIHDRIMPGRYAVISVTDTGTGIEEKLLEKIFEPFFTTKPTGQGTGLGLSVVFGIIQSHKGYIDLISKPGTGTSFKLYFPESLELKKPEKENADKISGGSEHILFVDDEPLVAQMGSEILTSLGYRVTATNSSLEALKFISENSNDFDLLMTDQTMPDMSGAELSKKVKQINKDIPIILCTGFSKTIDEKSAKEIGINSFCLKPLRMKAIAKEVRNVLESCRNR